MSNDNRYRSFAFVQLLENLPDNWNQQFQDMLCESCYIVHDQDEAKPHVHFFLYFQGKRSPNAVLKDIPEEFGIKHLERVRSKLAYIRYMLHWGYEDKFRYDWEDLKILGGLKVNVSDLASVDLSTVLTCLQEHEFSNFYEFVMYCNDHRPELLRFTQTHFQLIDRVITASL